MRPNFLKAHLQAKGIADISPDTETIENTLCMSVRRFRQIMDNRNVSELTASERDNVENWWYNLFQEQIDIFKAPDEDKDIILKHGMVKG